MNLDDQIDVLLKTRGISPIEKARKMLELYVENGGDVLQLSRDDKIYKYIKSVKIEIDGKRLSMEEVFARLGFPRPSKYGDPIIKGRKMLEEYVANGGDVGDLTKNDRIYKYISGVRIDGKRLSVEETFAFFGFPRRVHRWKSPIVRGRRMLEDYVANGGDVDNLSTKDEIYQYIKNAKITIDGNRLSVEESFAYLGFPRKSKIAKDVKAQLVCDIDEYLKNGGSFHVNRKSLPFFERLRTYRRALEREGIVFTNEQAMKSLGYNQYSNIYFRFFELHKIAEMQSEGEYIDIDSRTQGVLQKAAISTKLPAPLIVTLLYDKNMSSYFVEADYFNYVVQEMQNYVEKNGSLKGLSNKEPKLYQKFIHIKRYMFTGDLESLSSLDVLKAMGFDGVESFLTSAVRDFDLLKTIDKLRAASDDGSLEFSDIDKLDYCYLNVYSKRVGTSLKELLNSCGLDYKGQNKGYVLGRIKSHQYPYIAQMRQRRDELMEESGVSLENGYCKEEIFEKKFEVCRQVYEEFKEKIVIAQEKELSK